MRTVLFVLTLALTLAIACGAAAEPEEQAASPEAPKQAHPPVTDPEYCRSVSEAVNEIRDYFPPLKEYTEAIWTASNVIPSAYDEVMADKHFPLNIDVLAQLEYIDETAVEIKSLTVPENSEEGHRKAENLADDMMAQTADLRKKYAEMTQYEGYGVITQHSLGNTPEADVMKGYVDDFGTSANQLVFVYYGHVFDEFRGTEYCAGWWKVE